MSASDSTKDLSTKELSTTEQASAVPLVPTSPATEKIQEEAEYVVPDGGLRAWLTVLGG